VVEGSNGTRNPEAALADLHLIGEALTGWPLGNSFRLSFILFPISHWENVAAIIGRRESIHT